MCSQVFGVSVVLSGLLVVTSFRPWGAGCCASSVSVVPSPTAVASTVPVAALMNWRRFR